ncbi:maleylpyruvate isomerase family mycothiol-dependent enzyme [Kribbella sp. NBC_00709]|uniref:maleylpyruvate isomerase family mycothiol-dependent enzyme n=1 Tax=Kribbella sp. NBC_00709 TaxID=2975972 RepID=UPI002E2E5F66|nr:maleylpyruvate isomerase family mycothiol-dependent enzyme [Kribbella sp. NBC_00709]
MTDIRSAVAGERTELADVLAGLPEEDWDKATLCKGWRVRELVAHITMPYRISMPRFLAGLIKAGGKFDRYADRQARADADALSAEDLVDCLRQNVNHPWKPPCGGSVGALSHDVIHGLDVTVALGIDRQIPAERMHHILDDLNPKQVKYFGVDLTGVQLQATDLEWTYGTGAPLTGAAQDLLLVICGRTLPPNHLSGSDAARFTAGVTR